MKCANEPAPHVDLWRFSVDTGGTFTDCLAFDPQGVAHRIKVLSSSSLRATVVERLAPNRVRLSLGLHLECDALRGLTLRALGAETSSLRLLSFDPATQIVSLAGALPPGVERVAMVSPEPAPLFCARLVTQTALDEALPPLAMRLATTRGTNALLERRGAACALITTCGFADVLAIGDQARPDLFAQRVERPEPLPRIVCEINERVDAAGQVLRSLDLAAVERIAGALRREGVQSVALSFANAYANPEHERAAAEVLRALGFAHVAVSSALSSRLNFLRRTQTAAVDAYLGPIVRSYVDEVATPLESSQLHLMTSAGGLIAADSYLAKDSLLSGPAGGVVGAAAAGKAGGRDRLIGFDMGGTSTDVSRYDDGFSYEYELEIAGARIQTPTLAIETVAAGGGSICSFLDGAFRVGPESAGADPGPACYGLGGPLTITDVNLLLGRLAPDRFGIPVQQAAAERRCQELLSIASAADAAASVGKEAILAGLLDIANQRMAEAIRRISVREGYDPAEYALLAFGGAGGQHACAIADLLDMDTVVVPPDAGLLSALGLSEASIERFRETQLLQSLAQARGELERRFAALGEACLEAVRSEGVAKGSARVTRCALHMRFRGQDATLDVDYTEAGGVEQAFLERYRQVFGHVPEAREIEVVSLHAVAASTPSSPREVVPVDASHEATPVDAQRAYFRGEWIDAPLFDRGSLAPGARLYGPAIVCEAHSTTVIEPDWTGAIDAAGAIVLRKHVGGVAPEADSRERPEAVQVELFASRFQAIAREMGAQLQRTAVSTNVKERLDFSCALLDAEGRLVVNAPHIPVHLGAMGMCVRAVAAKLDLQPGDVVITNHPAFGGSHLPDITVVTPVFADEGKLVGYVANRAHHAEIGGARPGSMPPDATTLAVEGVVIEPQLLIERGEPRWQALESLLLSGRFPSRNVSDNLADLRAAVAANERGRSALLDLVARFGPDAVSHYMAALQQQAERAMRRALAALDDGAYTARELLDDGTPIAVRFEITGDRAAIDFAGSGGQHPGNLNATPAIVTSALLYVLRVLIDEPLPLNEGLLAPVEVTIPSGLLNPAFPRDPARCPAVVGGNVETSQRVVDTLLKALKLQAGSQGTMNNLLFGTERFGYYETIGGGTGAGPGFAGASAVHSHMTNTHITDVEVIEHRYPVRLERFEIRRGSGGNGQWRGGDGIRRVLRFLEPMQVSVLTQHRTVAPFGLAGGEEGEPGRQRVIRADGMEIVLKSVDGCDVQAGDQLIMETPGGGGYGAVPAT
jgi:5-oxoprolinase (ATP-hydrolysing)